MTFPHSRAVGRILLVVLLAQAPAVLGQAPPAKGLPSQQFVSRLAPTDPEDPRRPGCRHKVHTCQLNADTGYVIDLVLSPTLGAVVRLEDAAGRPLVGHNPGEGHNVRRIFFQPTRTDTYRLVVSALFPPEVGDYLLLVRQVPPGQQDLPHPGDWVELASPLPVDVDDLTIQLRSSPAGLYRDGRPNISHGYLEYRFAVRNRSAAASRQVRLTLGDSRPGRGGPHLRWLTGSVTIQPGSTAEVSLLQPNLPFTLYGGDSHILPVRIEIDGKARERTIPVRALNRGRPHLGGPHGEELQDVLCGPGVAEQLRQNIFKAGAGAALGFQFGKAGTWSGTYRGQRVDFPRNQNFHEAPGPVTTWGRTWLAHSGYAGIVAAGPEVQAAPPAVRQALWQYVECGGCLLLLGDCKLPDSWGRRQADVRGWTGYYAGFGLCLSTARPVAEWEPGQWRLLVQAWEHTDRPWRQVRSADQANEDFPVVEDVAIPVRGLFLSMVGFVVVAGPLNLYVLARRGRKIWMLWTVPALGLLACAAVVLYMVTTEGLRGHVRAEGVTVLDEAEGRASTVGWIGFYAPAVPADGLHFSPATELTPHLAPGRYRRSPQTGARTLDWTDEQHLASGWLAPRVPAHFMLRKAEARPERLLVKRSEGGALLVENGLGAPIRQLWLTDRQGGVYVAEGVAAGGKMGLTAQGAIEPNETRLAWLRDLYGREWLRQADAFRGQGAHTLQPGCYVAILDGAPFTEVGLRDPQSHKGTSVVFGIMKEPVDAR
jgi:hypothetical protein